jgi:hypothetical protein
MLSWAAVTVALMIVALISVPAELWRQPENDAIYMGFDRSLMYVDENGGYPERGIIEVNQNSLRLTALPNSQPTVHLSTTPLSKFVARMHVRILEAQHDDTPFRIGIWTPRNNHGFYVNFIGDQVLVRGIAWGQLVKEELLGSYTPGRQYRLEISIDKEAGNVMTIITGESEGSPYGRRALRISGRALPQWVSHIYSVPVDVRGGREYEFGGTIKRLRGPGPYGFVLEWLDNAKRRLGKSEQWHGVEETIGWTARKFRARAPAGASFAMLEIATAPGTDMLFTDLFILDAEGPKVNLLSNGDFRHGTSGWRRGSTEPIALELIEFSPSRVQSTMSRVELPGLFKELRLSLSVSASSRAAITSAVVDSYAVVLPHQRWLTMRIDDLRNRILISILLVAGVVLCLIRFVEWARPRGTTRRLLSVGRVSTWLQVRLQTYFRSQVIMAVLGGGALYITLNSILFNIGSLNYDLLSGTVWGYVLVRYGISQIYQLPAVTGIAEAWGGVPFQEAAFPYLPIMAYIFSAVGWIYKLFLAEPSTFARDAFRLAFVIRGFNALFSYASALLIYRILRHQGVNSRWSLVAAGFFLLNPAVWFIGSVWGQTQSWSIFFLLLAIWLGEKGKIFRAWLALALTALTRQQMLVPATLLAVVFLRRFSCRQNLQAVTWLVIAVFLILGPFLFIIGSSLVVDLLANAAKLHVKGLNDQWTSLVSWGALSVWPLITRFAHGESGLDRLVLSSRTPLIGGITYWQLGNWLFGVFFVTLATMVGLRGPSGNDGRNYIPAIALGTLGLFLLKTEFAPFHGLPALVLVVLSRKSMDDVTYCATVAALTATTFLAMYSIAAVWLSYNSIMSIGLFDPGNSLTRFFRAFITRDWFISIGSLANLTVLAWLALVTFLGSSPFLREVRPVKASSVKFGAPAPRG